jgi:hypothetical protein
MHCLRHLRKGMSDGHPGSTGEVIVSEEVRNYENHYNLLLTQGGIDNEKI